MFDSVQQSPLGGIFNFFTQPFDPNDPNSMARYGFMQGLVNASQPSPVRHSFFNVMGQAGLGAMQGRMQAQQNQLTNADLQTKQLGNTQSRVQINQTLAAINYFRRKAGQPELTLDDLNNPGKRAQQIPVPGDTAAGTAPSANAVQPPAPADGAQGVAPSGQTPPPQAQQAGQQPNLFNDFYTKFLAPHEGGFTANDGNGAPANMGINQKANPDVDVKGLTPEQAKQITYDRYWKASGADTLPPALAAIHGDTAFNMGQPTAEKMLQASGGDPQKYLALRAQRYQQIAQADPAKAKNLPTWMGRNADLATYAASIGQAGAQQGTSPPAPQGQAAPDFEAQIAQIGMFDPQLAEKMMAERMQGQRQPLTPEEIHAAGLQTGTAAQRNPFTGQIDVLTHPTEPMSPEAFAQQKELWGVRTGMGTDGQLGAMDPATIHYWGQVVKNGGQLPPLGMGPLAARLRQAILSDAAKADIAEGGSGAGHVATVATAKAGTQTLGKITALRNASESYENTMLQNINLAKQMMGKGAGQYGAPVINRWTQFMRKEYAGDPDVAAFNTAVQTVKNEYAKIQSGSLGNAPVTDAARREAEGMLDADQTPQQILANFNYMTQETGNRMRALRAQETALRSGLSGKSDQPTIAGIKEPQNAASSTQRKFVEGQIYQDGKGRLGKWIKGKMVPLAGAAP